MLHPIYSELQDPHSLSTLVTKSLSRGMAADIKLCELYYPKVSKSN